jgi:hypothetical protein
MLILTAVPVTKAEVEMHELDCDLVDYASIVAAELSNKTNFEGCNQLPAYSVALKPAEDMVIPFFLCQIHFNALKLSLQGGFGIDEDVFGSSSQQGD